MNAKPIVLVLLVAGLLTAAWFLFGRGDDAQPGPTPPGGNVTTPVKADGGGDPAGIAQAPVADADTVDQAAGAGSDPERTAVDTPAETNDRSARIEGRLVDAAGAAITDVQLRWREIRNPGRSEFLGPEAGGENAPRHELKLGADGRFMFELGRDRSAGLELPQSEYVMASEHHLVHGFRGDQDIGDVVVERSASITGVVQDEHGVPVADVGVSAVRGVLALGDMSMSRTNEKGEFVVGRLRSGKWTLRTASAKHLPARQEVTVQEGVKMRDVVLTVAVGAAIAGQVVDDRGRPVEGMQVGAKRIEKRGGIEVERFTNDEAATTDARGFFTLSGIEGERTTVRATGAGYGTAIAADVEVGTSDLLLRVERLASISGVLRGQDGKPIGGSRIRAMAGPTDSMLASHGIEGVLEDRMARTRTAADGSFTVEGVPPGAITLSASGDGHLPAKKSGIAVAPAQQLSGVDLVAERGAVATVVVRNEDGEPVAGAEVKVQEPPAAQEGMGLRMVSREVEDVDGEVFIRDGSAGLGSGKTDENGVAVIAGLPGERVAFHAEHPDFAPALPVTLALVKNGTIDVDLTVRTPGYAELRITGTDGAASERARYRVRGPKAQPDEDESTGRTDREGKAVVGPLAPGNYVAELVRAPGGQNIGGAMISFSGDGPQAIVGSEQTFRVEAGKTAVVNIQRPLLTRVHGVVSGATGPIAGAVVELEKGGAAATMPGGVPMGLAGGRSVTADANGVFEFTDVERGTYELSYGKPGQFVKAETEVVVPPELPELRQDLVLRAGTVRVQAWSQSQNRALEGVEVRLTRARNEAAGERREVRVMMVTVSSDGDMGQDSTMMTVGGQTVKTDREGWAVIEDVPAGEYEVRLTEDGHAPGTTKVAVRELQEADAGRVVLREAGRVRGRILGADGKPVRMGLVFHRPIDGEEGQPTMAMNGAFTIDSLPTGRYVLRGQSVGMGPGASRASTPELEVEIEAGKTAAADLQLPK